MRLIFNVILLMIFSFSLQAQSLAGKEVKPAVENNKARFGVTMANDSDNIFFVVLSMPGHELNSEGKITSVAYRLYDKQKNEYLTAWVDAERNSNAIYYPGAFVLQFALADKNEVSRLIASLKNLVILLAVNQPVNADQTHYVDFSSLCTSYPSNFIDLTTGKIGCN